jgi:hypothetical protein
VNVTDDIRGWLRTASVSVIRAEMINNISTAFDHYRHAITTEDQRLIYDRAIFPGPCYSSNLGIRAFRGLAISPYGLDISYYSFNGYDDKYFMLNAEGLAYQESLLYNDFYQKLPRVDNPSCAYTANVSDLWILPRAQYGHFLYDEAIPAICGYWHLFGKHPPRIRLLSTCSWQVIAIQSLLRLLKIDYIPVINVTLDQRSYAFRLYSGVVILCEHTAAIETYKQLRKPANTTSSNDLNTKFYLSRKGFDGHKQRRVVNHLQYESHMVSTGHVIVQPHLYTLFELSKILEFASIIISEPGTTPLLAYLAAPPECYFIDLFSKRTLVDCARRFNYSGWRYHLPWLSRIRDIHWGQPIVLHQNPFSDLCYYEVNNLSL